MKINHLFFLFFAGCNSCKEKFYAIKIDNKSNNKIYYYSCNKNYDICYPDTLLPVEKLKCVPIEINGRGYLYIRHSWKEVIANLPHDTLSIYFFDDGVYKDSSWAVIRENYLILDRYDLSIHDLEAKNFILQYP